MSPQTTHPLVDAYLRDLELLFHGIAPGERAEVLAGVHEHLDGRLDRETTAPNDDVRKALGELGPPQAIADEAYAGRSGLVPARTTRWTLRQRLASALLFPATLAGLGVVVGISYSLVGPSLVDTVPAVAVLGAAVWVLVRLTKAALR